MFVRKIDLFTDIDRELTKTYIHTTVIHATNWSKFTDWPPFYVFQVLVHQWKCNFMYTINKCLLAFNQQVQLTMKKRNETKNEQHTFDTNQTSFLFVFRNRMYRMENVSGANSVVVCIRLRIRAFQHICTQTQYTVHIRTFDTPWSRYISYLVHFIISCSYGYIHVCVGKLSILSNVCMFIRYWQFVPRSNTPFISPFSMYLVYNLVETISFHFIRPCQ